jgi:lipoate---protein ligase
MQEVECKKIENLLLVKPCPRTAQENMDLDSLHLNTAAKPVLHFYQWKHPATTYGYFTDPQEHFIEGHTYDIGRRPTGGGVLFHTHDLAFSLVIPSDHPLYSSDTLTNYQSINQIVLDAVLSVVPNLTLRAQEEISQPEIDPRFCMAKPTIFDVCLGPWKIAGAAQRLKKRALLHQGSISLSLPDWGKLEKTLVHADTLIPMMQAHTHELTPYAHIEHLREKVRDSLLEAFLVATLKKP